jgi:hypothetical protein
MVIGNDEFRFHVTGSSKSFSLRCKVESEFKNWAVHFYTEIEGSLGAKRQIAVKNDRYLEDYIISQSQFEAFVDTGDVLLFRGNTTNARALRTVMASDYDHVAIFLRDLEKKIYIIEATGTYGVSALSLDCFLENEWYKDYDKLIYRKLEVSRTEGFYNNFINFANKVLGLKYDLTVNKLMRQKSLANGQEEEGYFCS